MAQDWQQVSHGFRYLGDQSAVVHETRIRPGEFAFFPSIGSQGPQTVSASVCPVNREVGPGCSLRQWGLPYDSGLTVTYSPNAGGVGVPAMSGPARRWRGG